MKGNHRQFNEQPDELQEQNNGWSTIENFDWKCYNTPAVLRIRLLSSRSVQANSTKSPHFNRAAWKMEAIEMRLENV